MVSAPVNLQETFKTIIRSCRYIYKENKDYQGWAYLDVLAEMDSTTIAYSSGYFGLAMRSGFYEPVNPRRLSKKIKQKFKKNAELYAAASKMEQAGPLGFMRNEKCTCIDLSSEFRQLIEDKVKVCGIYGMDDGLYSQAQFDHLNSLINNNAYYYEQSSHSPFIDFQDAFIYDVCCWCK